MSYILDALKKADKERKRGTVPNLSTVQEPTPHKSKKNSLWPYILILALLINAGILILWLSPWESKEATIVAKSPVVVTHEPLSTVSSHEFSDIQSHSAIKSIQSEKAAPSGINDSEEKAPPDLQATVTPKKSFDTQQQKQTIPMHTAQKDEVPDESSKGIQTRESSSTTSTDESSMATTETTTSDQQQSSTTTPSGLRIRLHDLESLPSSIKENIPDINISVFVYSDDPASRVVKINGQTIREGQELADGLKVEKIVPNGVIFNYEDYRFRVGIR